MAASAIASAVTGGKVTGRNMKGLWKAPRKWSSAASATVPISPAAAPRPSSGPAGRPSRLGSLPMLAFEDEARGGKPGQPGESDRDRRAERRAVEQVQEIEPALALGNIVEVKTEAADAGGEGETGTAPFAPARNAPASRSYRRLLASEAAATVGARYIAGL